MVDISAFVISSPQPSREPSSKSGAKLQHSWQKTTLSAHYSTIFSQKNSFPRLVPLPLLSHPSLISQLSIFQPPTNLPSVEPMSPRFTESSQSAATYTLKL